MATSTGASYPVDSSPSAPSSSTGSASLSALPPELKLKIILEARRDDLDDDDPFALLVGKAYEAEYGIGGKAPTTLARLSLASREFHALCIPYLWEVSAFFPSSQGLLISLHPQTIHLAARKYDEDILEEDEILREAILPRYSQHVRQLQFKCEEYEQEQVEEEGDEEYGDDNGGEYDPEPLALADSLGRLLYFLPSLETVQLSVRQMDDLPELDKPLPLKRLRLHVQFGAELDSSFFSAVSGHVEDLVLEGYIPSATTVTFPRLTRLAFFFSYGLGLLRLPIFSNSPLQYLYINTFTAGSLPEILAALEAWFSTLRVLRLDQQSLRYGSGERPQVESNLAAIERWCTSHGVEATLPTVADLPW
ncbi:hypothetical protein JCM8097_008100 [Rhodosporidiobolus ruineniae]